MELYLIDAIGPFFLDYEREQVNWSKIPFENLETKGSFDWSKFERIREQFQLFLKKVSALGFNAVTVDDLAHVTLHEFYDSTIRSKVEDYQKAYSLLFEDAARCGLTVYLTSDVMFFEEGLRSEFGSDVQKCSDFLAAACSQAFERFPALAGMIFRIGEADGADVKSDFLSDIILKTPKDARLFLKTLLPLFEREDKQLVFRTWSVGVYEIGDLIWNRNTFAEVFGEIESENLIISMKYGESDFFRFLPLNKMFFRSSHRKIIEFQARREYEGFGEYPSFIGWEYQSYMTQLEKAENLIGCSVWCQTGGWSRFRRLTFLQGSSIWNELNTYVTIQLFRYGHSPEEAIESFCKERLGITEWRKFLELLRLSDEAIHELIYLDDFSSRKIFFRRLRVPPVLWVFWDTIIVNHLMRKLVKAYVEEPEQVVREGRSALEKVRKMSSLAESLGLSESGIDFQLATFELLCAAREYYLLPFSAERQEKLERLKASYEAQYPKGYRIELNFRPFFISSRMLSRALSLLLRDKRGYRLFDRLFTIRLLRLIYPLVKWWERKWLPEMARDRAMGIDSIFK